MQVLKTVTALSLKSISTKKVSSVKFVLYAKTGSHTLDKKLTTP